MADIAVGNVIDAIGGKRPRTVVNEAVYQEPGRLRGAVAEGQR
jgi:hypothetical protein